MTSGWIQGAVHEVTVEGLAAGGDGVARWQDRVVFIPNAVPGDLLRVKLMRVKPREGYAQIEQILVPSPHRVRPRCIVADKCGGCQWQTVAYAQQIQAKYDQVSQALGPSAPVLPVWEAPQDLGYRNKATYPLAQNAHGELIAGYYRPNSHRVINLNQCPVQDPRLDPVLAGVKQLLAAQGWSVYDENTHSGLLRHLGLRIGQRTGEVLVTLVTTDDPPHLDRWAKAVSAQFPEVVGVLWNHQPQRNNVIFGPQTQTLWGRAYLREIFCGLEFHIGATTFFQIHTAQAERLVELVIHEAQLTGADQVVDAYSGIGTISLPLAQAGASVTGIESWGPSVEQARANAQRQGIPCTFVHSTVEDWLPRQKNAPHVLCLDPPRKGCAPEVLNALIKFPPRRVLYVSCNPATLGRDLKILTAGGYELIKVQPVDFFPQTYHVECLAVLEYRG